MKPSACNQWHDDDEAVAVKRVDAENENWFWFCACSMPLSKAGNWGFTLPADSQKKTDEADSVYWL